MALPKPANYYFLVPLLSFIPWYVMLITFLITWAADGHPVYYFMHNKEQTTVYISDIGAMSLHPMFIICSGLQGLGYCVSVACEYYQRSGHWPFMRNRNNPSDKEYNRRNQNIIQDDPEDPEDPFADEYDDVLDDDQRSFDTIRKNYTESLLSSKFLMPPFYTKDERNLIFASFVLGLLGELALLLCSIFSTATHHNAHISLVVVFIVLMYISCSCLIAEYFLMGRHYAVLHPLANLDHKVDMKNMPLWKWEGYVWNKFTISGVLKSVWIALAILWALLFAGIDDESTSAVFEWILSFWLGVFFMIMSVDFYLGGRYKCSRYFHQVESFAGYYKYDNVVNNNHNASQQQQPTYFAHDSNNRAILEDPFQDIDLETESIKLNLH
ncbi:hypothetical protein TPHA_0N01400 [Tetrapisispora phaffii CBS 4417]|uniref:CWH43-like N-terminal domain-containing protein n=1 Tax=Tetrapisispora phaffii (strain ATCC 24235 / CBS 4417 / NBRC 1672 / NRRL Y-8282 / UCD 70-5) TaxID=1071381 RepID=G8C193_TETPH|nr:hypothetical protein TPHA_0N01400 [Tetrapisispora phaffii CBS 4417]CCE65921.1 hypothetical protein TPHA_0N01400 [Tetrapisispora phaffii CBS 4417]